jgi:cullin 1
MDPKFLKPVMHSLCCGKYKVIAKNPSTSKITDKDSFTVNKKFKSPNKKVKIPMASLDANANTKKVEEDRSITIDAALVRIMKSRKTLDHQTLIAEVLSQLHFFKPNAKQIKKRIESLLEREYLERSEDNPGHYNYLA